MTLSRGLQLRSRFPVNRAISRPTPPGLRLAKHTGISARSASSWVCGTAPEQFLTEPKKTLSVSIVDDKVENWSSEKYAHYPFRPDLTLFEPVEICARHGTRSRMIQNSPPVDTSAAVCERLAYLIETDVVAAQEMKNEILRNHIKLPAHPTITEHCFNLLLRENDVQGYLEWLDILPNSALQNETSQIQNVFDFHLKQIICLCPRKLGIVQDFFYKILVKGCLTDSLIRTTVSHLVRTQSPETVLKFHHDASKHILHQSTLSENPKELLHLLEKLNNFTILQLANQKHLTEALDLVFKRDQKSDLYMKTISTFTYRVLADQLLLIVSNTQQQTEKSSFWTDQLNQVLSSWKLSHPISLKQWLSSSQGTCPKLPSGSIMKHKVSRSRHRLTTLRSSLASGLHTSLNDPEDTVHRLVLYLRTVLSQERHAKFIRSSHIADNISKIISTGNLDSLSEQQLGYSESQQDQEQYMRALVFDQSTLLKFMRKAKAEEKVLLFEEKILSSKCIKLQGDVILIWAHSWMIFYQRIGLYNQVVEIFLRYFVSIGVDRDFLLNFRVNTTTTSTNAPLIDSHRVDPVINLNTIPLIHPTTGVLNVLYDSILRLLPAVALSSPTKSISTILASFVEQNLTNSSTISSKCLNHQEILPTRISPTLKSFRPFVRAFLRIGDIDQALRLMIKIQQLQLSFSDTECKTNIISNDVDVDDEGLWIDILEYCASQSAGFNLSSSSSFKGENISFKDGKKINFCWGSERKKKKLGWSGEMKERLVYSTLDRFLLLSSKFYKPKDDFILNDLIVVDDINEEKCSSMIDSTRRLIPSKLYGQHLPLIDKILDQLINPNFGGQVDLSKTDGNINNYRAFPSLKLLCRVKSGFETCGNKRGVKILNRLVDWRKGFV